jgi:hypothetical protein
MAMNKAKEIYSKLMVLFNNGDRQLESYVEVAKEYVQLKLKYGTPKNGVNQIYTLNGKEYTMYNTLIFDNDFARLAEDLTMMVYRLNDGKGYSTYDLIEAITKTILHDDYGNTATIKEKYLLPYKGATRKEKGYILTLTSDYDNDMVYFVSIYESFDEAMKKLNNFSCGTWR